MGDVKIGLECHVQLNTKTKFFCSCPNSQDAEPNSNCCPVCLGLPGARPRVNSKAIKYGIRIGLALGCDFPKESHFSRKSYFYPDMPKNFQITQYGIPLAEGGSLRIEDNEVGIGRINLEEDPGKLRHVGGSIDKADYVLVDYNRAGVPLCEIVTDPDLRSPEEAKKFLRKLISILEFVGVYDSNKSTIRCDANISIEGGARVEVKNILGAKGVAKAISYEISRHRSMKMRGEEVERETRHWDEGAGVTRSLRQKEEEQDYGYIYEPDLTSISLDDEKINRIENRMPKLPSEKVKEFQDKGIGRKQAEVVVNRGESLTKFLENCLEFYDNQEVANFTAYRLLKILNKEEISIEEADLDPKEYVKIIKKLDKGRLNKRQAEEILEKYVKEDSKPSDLLKREKYQQKKLTQDLLEEVIQKNGEAVEDYKKGKEEAIDFLVGEVIKKTEGKADPKTARKKLEEYLNPD